MNCLYTLGNVILYCVIWVFIVFSIVFLSSAATEVMFLQSEWTCHHHQQELLLGATFYWLVMVSRTKLIHPFTDFIILHVLWREFKNKVKFKNLLKQSTALAFPWWCGSGTVRPTVPPPRLRNIRSICVISNILTLLYILYNRPIWYSKVK